MVRRSAALILMVGFAGCGGSQPSASGPPTATLSPASIAGSYTMTLTVSAACDDQIAPTVRAFTYPVVVAQNGDRFSTSAVDGRGNPLTSFVLAGTVAGDAVALSLDLFDDFGTFRGQGGATASDGTIRGKFGGEIFVNYYLYPAGKCTANDHGISLVRR